MSKKVNFIVYNLYLNRYDYREINKSMKIPALQKKKKVTIKIANSHLIMEVT